MMIGRLNFGVSVDNGFIGEQPHCKLRTICISFRGNYTWKVKFELYSPGEVNIRAKSTFSKVRVKSKMILYVGYHSSV